MSNFRTPGVVCPVLQGLEIDKGTLARWVSCPPASTGLEQAGDAGEFLQCRTTQAKDSLSPLDFMKRYRTLKVEAATEDASVGLSLKVTYTAQLLKYFMMDWREGSEEIEDFRFVSAKSSKKDAWFNTHKQSIRTAAMGKGSPDDYELALEWAVRSGKIPNPSQAAIQFYCDMYLGIDCSGFVTNYLIAKGLRADSDVTKRNTGAAAYFRAERAINDPSKIRQGDLLVWMTSENLVKTKPGHIAVVQAYEARSTTGGNMRVIEATGAKGATPKLLDSMYSVERIIDKGNNSPAMILVVQRHGKSGSRVAVIRESA